MMKKKRPIKVSPKGQIRSVFTPTVTNTGDFKNTITHSTKPVESDVKWLTALSGMDFAWISLRARGQHDQNWSPFTAIFCPSACFTRSPRRFPTANRHGQERIPASIMEGLGDTWCEIYLFGWKQEFNSVRRILGACHLRMSHDASRALPATPTTLLLPSQTQDGRLRRGRCHSSWRFWVSSCFR